MASVKLDDLPAWVQEIVEGVKRRAVLWQAVNGLSKPELRPEDRQTMLLVQALAMAIRALEAVVGTSTLDEAKDVARGTLAALRSGDQGRVMDLRRDGHDVAMSKP